VLTIFEQEGFNFLLFWDDVFYGRTNVHILQLNVAMWVPCAVHGWKLRPWSLCWIKMLVSSIYIIILSWYR